MLLFYTSHITNRINYIMQYVFEEKLGLAYRLTSNADEYANDSSHIKIAYSPEYINEGLYFYAYPLLFENDIKEIELHTGNYKNIVTLFEHDKKSALNFDVFAAAFYLLSRYEEYLDKPKDKHGNYDFHNSILHQQNLLDTPVVEQWIEALKETLLQYFPSIQFKNSKAKFVLSFDVDVAYAYKHKGFARTIGALAQRIVLFRIGEAKQQLSTLLNKQEDIFDTYHYIFTSIQNKKPVFFFDMGDHGEFDKNPSYQNKYFRVLIKDISTKAIVGVHPSYTSNTSKELVTTEKNKLENITGKPVTKSRQHYLKLKLPQTYVTLINNHIDEDFTPGYSGMYGYRAGTCNSFLFFNLQENKSTNLRIYPFAYMDVTLNNYLNLDIEASKKIVSKLIEDVVRYKGIFIPLWHNSTLCDCGEWKGWREVFEHTLQEIDNNSLENLFA